MGGPLFVCDDSLITLGKRNGPPRLLGRKGGPFLGAMEAPVVMVGTDSVEVERRLRAGELACPCGGGLAPWGHARERDGPRGRGVAAAPRVAAARCLVTHVLLAVSCLLRRADGVEVIGAALRVKAAGAGHRPIAARLGRPASTVRGWLRAFARNAERCGGCSRRCWCELDPLAGPLPSRPGGVRRRGGG